MLKQKQDLVGRRILLHLMDEDPKTNPIPPNTMGTILSVDDMDYYKVKWDNGRIYPLLTNEDKFEFID
jgi:hypothetical protein